MPNAEDIMHRIIDDGIDRIYDQYAEGKIGKAALLERLSGFLDSKGVLEHALIALAAVKDWKR